MQYNLNSTQNFYYLRAILGLGIYTREELLSLGNQKRQRIIKVHRKANKAIEELKYQRVIEISNQLISKYFNKGAMYKELMSENSVNFTDENFRVNFTDKELGITKDEIITCLIEKGVLGPNFLKLK